MRTSLTPTIRHRLEVQGYACSDAPAFARIVPWLRFTPALCTFVVAVGTALRAPGILWSLVPLAALGAIFPRHPFDLLYNATVRHLAGTAPLPPNGAPRRFACGMAAAWLIPTAWAFTAGDLWAGYILGTILVAAGAVVSVSHVCIPSIVYNALLRPRRASTG
jgi:hypothetical protein